MVYEIQLGGSHTIIRAPLSWGWHFYKGIYNIKLANKGNKGTTGLPSRGIVQYMVYEIQSHASPSLPHPQMVVAVGPAVNTSRTHKAQRWG